MHCSTARWLGLTALLAILSFTNAGATGKIAIDALHGVPDVSRWDPTPTLSQLYPNYHFILIDKSRVPIYDVLAEGSSGDAYYDSAIVSVTEEARCLYAVVEGGGGPFMQDPIAWIVGPDQTVTAGGYGVVHLDDPEVGIYTVYISHATSCTYRIGTGPNIWDVYPPEDYDAILDLRCSTLYAFTGTPTFRSARDYTRLQQFADSGGGIGVYYDESEPIALKPIIHLQDFTVDGATIRINVPGHLTYSVPPPQKSAPLTYDLAPQRGDMELDYEAEFYRPLNFVARGRQLNEYLNPSWATVHDVKILRFDRNEGYRISEVGTLDPGKSGLVRESVCLLFNAAAGVLDAQLRSEALRSGLTPAETDEFFLKYQWTRRLLAEACASQGAVVLYRIEGDDYDGLFPLSTDPAPAELRRIIWVFSILPDAVTQTYPVHPRVAALPSLPGTRHGGRYHEYGFFREHYGGDALDDMDAWGWHLYDQMLIDDDDSSGWDGINFHMWGESPLVPRLSQGITQVRGGFTGGITPAAGSGDVLLTGDDNTHTEDPGGPFPVGSFPPVAVARQETNGGRLFGAGDMEFLLNIYDNRQFTENVFAWLTEGNTGGGPDIDIPVALIETTLVQNCTAISQLQVINQGSEPLTYTTTIPSTEWFGATGPTQITLLSGDSAAYMLTWTTTGMLPGRYLINWIFESNDPNESTLAWPVRLTVEGTNTVDPDRPHGTPREFVLHPAFPNPFNPVTTVSFTLSKPEMVELDLYNIVGQRVLSLGPEQWTAGTHQLSVDLNDRPAGLYFLRAESASVVQVQKLMLIK